MRAKLWLVAVAVSLSACITRAPTTYELDRRAGFMPPDDQMDKSDKNALADVRTSSAVARAPRMPVKVPPLIEKVWVSDVPLGDDARLQGTWMFMEVERGRWLDEIDPGGGPVVLPPGTPGLSRVSRPAPKGALAAGESLGLILTPEGTAPTP